MNTFFHFVILLLAASSLYDQFPSFLSVEARKLNYNGGIFTIDLIHRDTLLSPQERQKRLPLGTVSRRGHRANLSSAYYEKDDVQTPITPSGGDYLIKMAIGTPPFEFMAVADTGSDLIWLQCSPCQTTQSCIQQQSPFFDPTTSSSYQTVACNSPACGNPDLQTQCGENYAVGNGECMYSVLYGDGTKSSGVLSTDTITFPSADVSLTLPKSVFGCGNDQQGSVSGGSGIIGLGVGPSSLVSQLGRNINYKFSYCLVPLSSEATSKLRFGGDVTSPGVVSTPFLIKENSDHYFLTLDKISIGDMSQVPVGQDVIIDSGSTLTLLETNVYIGVKDALKSAIGVSPISNPDDTKLCYDKQESLNPPDVVFHFGAADVALKAINIFREDENGGNCLAMLPTDDDTYIFGNVAQVNFEVGYDLQAKQVSFAPRDCTTY